jgi:hypothetical protein
LGGLWFKTAWANSSRDIISKITRTKLTGSVAQMVEVPALQAQSSESNPNPTESVFTISKNTKKKS